MLTGEQLLCAMSGAREQDILAAAQALGYLPAPRRKNYWRPLLIAAVLTALLAATVVAVGLLGRAERLAPMPPDPSGEVRQAEIPNGFRGTPTFQGSAAWWDYMAKWNLDHDREARDYSLAFIRDDLDRYLVCSLYEAYDREQAETLYRIAGEYGLTLYREMVYFGSDQEEFYALTGVEPFLNQKDLRPWGGYVLEDGSFSLEFPLDAANVAVGCTLHRYYTGSIYPFGGADRLRPYEEQEYTTARGDFVFLDVFEPGKAEITYSDPKGEVYLTVSPHLDPGKDTLTEAQKVADLIDFRALCRKDTGHVLEILNQPTGAEKNPEAVRKLEAFQSSPAFRGAREFQTFYEENFYGPCFTGTYGMADCGDIDRELERLGEKYSLRYAREKTRGGKYGRRSITFDNGAWQAQPRGAWILHYIPKDALYTMQCSFLEAGAYRRIWEYTTREGQHLVLCTQGPIRSKYAGGYALMETEKAYVMLSFHNMDPMWMEQRAEAFDWTIFE